MTLHKFKDKAAKIGANYQPIKETVVVEETDEKNPVVKAAKVKQNAKYKHAIITWTLSPRSRTPTGL